jgi:hypothetical protein
MKESPTLVELSPQEIAELQTLTRRLGTQEYPTIERLLKHTGKDSIFLNGPDCSRVPKEEAKLHYERGKIMDAIGKKLETLRVESWPSPYKLRFVVARRESEHQPLRLTVIEMVSDPSGGLSEHAQEDLQKALGFLSGEYRYLQEMKPARWYPEDDIVLDETRTRELINEIKRLLSADNPHLYKVSSELMEALKSNLPILSYALKEGLYVWLSRA